MDQWRHADRICLHEDAWGVDSRFYQRLTVQGGGNPRKSAL
jgi:hypothetical protein